MSVPFQCADLSPEGIRCPVVNCNDRTGRFLFQLLDFERLEHRKRWRDWVLSLPRAERSKKLKQFSL